VGLASRKLFVVTALSIGAVTVAASVAASVGPLTRASGPSPFASCTVGGSGTVSANGEVEPYVAVDPSDPNHLIGAWQQDRWDSGGGAHGNAGAISHDGGATWAESAAHFTLCSGGTTANGGDYERASDPWVSFSPNGDAYQIALSFNVSDFGNGILVSKLAHGSDTWGEPVSLIRDTSLFAQNDKESITADPADSRYVYAVWDRATKPGENTSLNAAHSWAFRGDQMFSMTSNGGATWSTARNLLPSNAHIATIGNIVSVLPDGTLVDVFEAANGSGKQSSPNQFTENVIRSTDRGKTWSPFIKISNDQSVVARDPETGYGVRTGCGLPAPAVAPNGTLYVTWCDSRFSGGAVDDIALSKSTDGGLTWSEPIKVNKTPVPVSAFDPEVDVVPNGTVAVTYYDFRNDASDPATLPTDAWIVYSTDAGATWGGEQRLTPTSFDIYTGPTVSAGHPFIGDYEGLAHAGNTFLPFFVTTNSDTANPSDVVLTHATP